MFGMSAVSMALSLGLPALAIALLAGAGATYAYVPLVGKIIAKGLVIGSAAVFAFDAGYRERASLDASADLRSQLSVAKAEADQARADVVYAKGIARDAEAAQALAEDEANQVQKQVDAYATAITKIPKRGGCGLSAGDVAGLRRIGGH